MAGSGDAPFSAARGLSDRSGPFPTPPQPSSAASLTSGCVARRGQVDEERHVTPPARAIR
ncbi:predicted protein [Streptomyces sp. SPB78]|nr:predicted protein [Streptomyces sp. SPB78]